MSPVNKVRLPLPDSATLAVIVAPRRRGKSLARRKYQQGYIFQKGRKRSDAWLPKLPAYVQFWRDVPGEPKQKRDVALLGICRTRSIAERAAAEKLEQLGINSAQTFVETTSTITFRDQGEIWLKALANRKRNPLEQTTIDTRSYALDKWIYPFFEGKLLADVNNLAVRDFVEHISRLAPATIRDYSNIVKAVVASAVHQNGERLFPRTWNEEFIDAPAVKYQKQPSTDKKGGEHPERSGGAVSRALCASRGMRSAARRRGARPRDRQAYQRRLPHSLHSPEGETWRDSGIHKNDKRNRTPLPRRNHWQGCGPLYVAGCAGQRSHWQTALRAPVPHIHWKATFANQCPPQQPSPHPQKLKYEQGGFNIFRRFRITELQTAECPKPLQHFWSGHAQMHVSERYIKLLRDREYRLEWAEKIGMGFELPGRSGSEKLAKAPSIGQLGQLIQFKKTG